MPGDYSRKIFDPKKHYNGVLMQQGRVQLDADWNEQLTIQHHRTETEAQDEIGLCGVPKKIGGFKIEETPEGQDLVIAPGRIYVGGRLCELEATALPITLVAGHPDQLRVPALIVDGREFQIGQWVRITASQKADKVLQITDLDTDQNILAFSASLADLQGASDATLRRVTTYVTQPDYPNPDFASSLTSPPSSPPLSPPSGPSHLILDDGIYLAFLDVWQREITALDDRLIREVALGGPDTTTRLKTVWQVKLLPVDAGSASPPASPPGGQVTCKTPFPEFDLYSAPSTGRLKAQTAPPQDQKDPCLLPPSAGYRGLENQLYRVEVHTGGPAHLATFKWSRENASVETAIQDFDGNTVTVSDTGKDEVLGFAGGQWVEIVDDESTLKGSPRQLVQIDRVINQTPHQIIMTTPVTPVAKAFNPKLRRWDQTGTGANETGVQMNAGNWIDLESGIQVQFSEGIYRAGDYWLIPARTATGDIEWPPYQVPNTKPLAQPPKGIHHSYCRLALLGVTGGLVQVTADCRPLFPPLTNICAEDICFDNSKCALPAAETVQDAIDVLCLERSGFCTFTVTQNSDLQEVAASVPSQGAEICFQTGTYNLDAPVKFTGSGHLKITGYRGTQIRVKGSETALAFENWASVTVQGIYAESDTAKTKDSLNGVLSFIDCDEVTVESVALSCGYGSDRRVTCVTVRPVKKPQGARSVRIKNSALEVGDDQVGILLVSVDRSQIEDNALRTQAWKTAPSLPERLKDLAYRSRLRKLLFSHAVAGTIAAGAPPPPLRDKTNTSIVFGNFFVQFMTPRILTGKVWQALIKEFPPTAVNSAMDLQRYMETLANRTLLDASVRNQFNAFGTWFDDLGQKTFPAGQQGIVIGGQSAREVRIINNTVTGFLQGIHLGVSHQEQNAGAPDLARLVTISGNNIGVSLPPDVSREERHGVFVGNCRSLMIENNYVESLEGNPIEGIRLFGHFGQRVIVRHNHLVACDPGIFIKPLQAFPEKQFLWLAADNIAVGAKVSVVAPKSVKKTYEYVDANKKVRDTNIPPED
jgi:hypothetical protein